MSELSWMSQAFLASAEVPGLSDLLVKIKATEKSVWKWEEAHKITSDFLEFVRSQRIQQTSRFFKTKRERAQVHGIGSLADKVDAAERGWWDQAIRSENWSNVKPEYYAGFHADKAAVDAALGGDQEIEASRAVVDRILSIEDKATAQVRRHDQLRQQVIQWRAMQPRDEPLPAENIFWSFDQFSEEDIAACSARYGNDLTEPAVRHEHIVLHLPTASAFVDNPQLFCAWVARVARTGLYHASTGLDVVDYLGMRMVGAGMAGAWEIAIQQPQPVPPPSRLSGLWAALRRRVSLGS